MAGNTLRLVVFGVVVVDVAVDVWNDHVDVDVSLGVFGEWWKITHPVCDGVILLLWQCGDCVLVGSFRHLVKHKYKYTYTERLKRNLAVLKRKQSYFVTYQHNLTLRV